MIHYRKLCQFNMEHEYYKTHGDQNNASTPQLMQIKPTPACEYLLKRSRGGFKVKHNQLLLYCEVTETRSDGSFVVPQILRQRQTFTFALYPLLPALLEISAFDMPQNSVVNFRNSQLQQTANQQLASLMMPATQEQWQQGGNWHQLQKHLFVWPYTKPAQKTAKNWYLIAVNSGEKLPIELITLYSDGLQIDLRGYPAGEYQLFWASTAQASFYVDDNLCWRAPLAVLTLQTGPELPVDSQFIDAQTGVITEKNFIMSMPARQTIWRYFVVARYLSDQQQALSIDSDKAEYRFHPPQQLQKSDGTRVFRFDSVQPITLTVQGVKGLTLSGKRQGVLIDNLPSPRADQLVIEHGQAFSDMYIYV
ncbi:hypothetical protein [Pseudoalteromonas sp. S16_S37]|uniref:hypothetical protein n=1 Tax=Pseudoalteromonas sp. S16_S37 TaxID=2720228 RepID=UPI0016808039|nr:hypothetical protein [Pseudoalteromonas sp. S16_S37]MBD1580862.1 hypothetical protein [Pseudoalteromonas sp. S16_S37]